MAHYVVLSRRDYSWPEPRKNLSPESAYAYDDSSRHPDPLRDTVLQFVENIRSAVPTDFSFVLVFTLAEMHLSVDFEDGNTGSFCGGSFFTSFKSLRR